MVQVPCLQRTCALFSAIRESYRFQSRSNYLTICCPQELFRHAGEGPRKFEKEDRTMTRRLRVLLSAGVFLLPCLPLAAADGTPPSPTFARPVSFAVSAPLREIAKLPAPTQWGFHNTETQARIPKPLRAVGRVVDPVEQSVA